ncbi:MAG: hypothetical protein AAFW87_01600 [Pseudomonadota bacterium]
MRLAVAARVCEGLSIAAAAEKAGLSRNGFSKALKRPEVQQHLQQVQAAYLAEVDAKRALFKSRALEVAADLMMNAKSETVRLRAAEFLAGNGKTAAVAIHVDARARGYEYPEPGQRIVEIEPSGS